LAQAAPGLAHLSSVVAYDPLAGRWSAARAPMRNRRASFGAALLPSGAAATAFLLAAVLTEIYLGSVCSSQKD
jgi:hypothetical protein